MVDDIEEAFNNVDSELRETHQELEDDLPDPVYRELTDRVDAEVEAAATDIVKVTRVRKQKLEELKEAEERNGSEDPDLFERVNIRINALHPSGIANDIQEATDFDGFVENYLTFQEHLQNGPLASKVASRYAMPEKVARYMAAQCADAFSCVEESLENHSETVANHIEELNELTESKLGKGIAMFANVASNVAMGAAMSALTGSSFVGRGARKKASSGVGGWVAKKYFGSKIKRRKKNIIRSFEQFSESYRPARKECEARLELTALILYGGALRQLENDLNGADQSISEVAWDEGYIEPQLRTDSEGKYREWAVDTAEELSQFSKKNRWVELTDAAEVALQYSLESRSRSQVIGSRNSTSYSVEFARRRAEGILEVADEAWAEGNYKEAAHLYLELFTGSPVSFDHSRYDSATAGWRLALVGTSPEAPEHLKMYSLGLLPYVQQIAARQKAKGGRHGLPGEKLGEESRKIASVLHQFAKETNRDENVDRRIPKDLRRSSITGTAAWTEPSSASFYDITEEFDVPNSLESSEFAQWISDKRWQQKKRRLLIGGAVVLAAALGIMIFFLFG